MTTWNPIEKGSVTTLSNGNLTANNILNNSSVKSTDPKPSGKWFCEIKVDALNFNCIGIGSSDLPMASGITSSNNFFYYYSDGRKSNGGLTSTYASALSVGDIVGILIDFDAGTLTYYKNGENLGIAFDNIKKLSNFCIVVSSGTMSGNGAVTANFGETPFVYPPDFNDLPFGVKSYDGSQALSKESKSFIFNNGNYMKWEKGNSYQEINEKLHPNMLSTNSPSPYVISASSSQGIYVPYLAFDGLNIGGNNVWNPTYQTVTNQWIQIYIGESKVANKIAMSTTDSTKAPKDFDILGSNNGVDFTVIKGYRNQVGWTNLLQREFLFDNEKSYSYYRVFVYNNNGSTEYISISELTFYNTKVIQKRLPNWSTVSFSPPNSNQFREQGIDSLSLLNRTVTEIVPTAMTKRSDILGVGEVGNVFSKTIDLKKYLDIRSIKVEVM